MLAHEYRRPHEDDTYSFNCRLIVAVIFLGYRAIRVKVRLLIERRVIVIVDRGGISRPPEVIDHDIYHQIHASRV